MRLVLFAALILTLAGCSSRDEERRAQREAQCVTADWRGIGYEDGAKGSKTSTIARHRKACAEFGVTPNLDEYLGGHAKGIAYYCQPRNGYFMGTKGRRYTGGCPASQDAAFAAATDTGYGLYERQRAVDDTGERYHFAAQRSKEIEFLLTDKGTAVISPLTLPGDRMVLVVEIKQLAEEKAALNRSIPGLQADYGAAQHELDAYRSSIAGQYSS
jgi:hypothetical protein